MGAIGLILIVLGGLAALVGGLWLLVLAFQESILWGLCSLFIPLVILIFALTHWEVAKKPFLIQIGGVVLYFLGAALGGSAGGST
jgi:hypothetical protein